MSLLSKMASLGRSRTEPLKPAAPANALTSASANQAHADEIEHWNEIARRAAAGERLFWLNHPRVAERHNRKYLIDGLMWRDWVLRTLGGPAHAALELGCGRGGQVAALVRDGYAQTAVGVDLGDSRFEPVPAAQAASVQFRAVDVNRIQIEPNHYDLIYSLQSFHHFEALEHIMEQVSGGLTDRGFFVLDEFVGPSRFQWTELQLSVIAELLSLMPKPLRMYAHGIEKLAEGRSTPEQVIEVCASEAIRSAEIVELFYKYFEVVHERKLGGTIQHLLYSGIVQNFPDNDPATDRMIDSIDSLETRMIQCGALPSDFTLLIGRRRS